MIHSNLTVSIFQLMSAPPGGHVHVFDAKPVISEDGSSEEPVARW